MQISASSRLKPVRLPSVPVFVWVCVAAIALCGLHLLWLARFRWGFVGDWDESGYASIGFRALEGFRFGGLGTLYDVLNDSFGGQPPLVPVSAVPFIVLFGHSFDVALLAELPYFFLLVLSTYGVARRLTSPRWAALAALVVGTAPVVSDYTRLFSFAVPAAALLTTALWALLMSQGLRRLRWAVLAGAMLGLMLLARTMTVAYLPGVAVGVAAPLVLERRELGRRVAGFALLCSVAVGVAAIWWVPNFSVVRSYLTKTGYGPEALNYGPHYSFFSLHYWTREVRLVADYLFLPLALVLIACFVVAAVLAIRRGPPRAEWLDRAKAWVVSPSFLLAAVVVEGYLALTSTSNEGSAFSLPWLPALIVLALAAAAATPAPRLRLALAAALIGVVVLNLAVKNGVSETLGRPRDVHVPGVGGVSVLDGRDVMYQAVAGSGVPVSPPPAHLPEPYRRWLPFDRDLASFIVRFGDAHGRNPFLVPLTGDFILSDTRIVLAAELCCRRQLLTLGGLPGPDTTAAYRRELADSGVNFVITADPQPLQRVQITRGKVERATRDLGFRVVKRATAPDGRRVDLWWRNRA